MDSNLKDSSATIRKMLKDFGVDYVSLARDNIVEGRSWEMAVSQALLNYDGVYSGTLESYNDTKVVYGPVPGLDVKRKMINSKLITSKELKVVLFSR